MWLLCFVLCFQILYMAGFQISEIISKCLPMRPARFCGSSNLKAEMCNRWALMENTGCFIVRTITFFFSGATDNTYTDIWTHTQRHVNKAEDELTCFTFLFADLIIGENKKIHIYIVLFFNGKWNSWCNFYPNSTIILKSKQKTEDNTNFIAQFSSEGIMFHSLQKIYL